MNIFLYRVHKETDLKLHPLGFSKNLHCEYVCLMQSLRCYVSGLDSRGTVPGHRCVFITFVAACHIPRALLLRHFWQMDLKFNHSIWLFATRTLSPCGTRRRYITETYCKSFAHLLVHDTTYAQCVARHMLATIWWVNGSRESVRQTTRFAAEYFHHAQFFVALTYSNTTWRGVYNPARRGAKFVWRGNPRAMSFAIDDIMEM